MYQMKIVLGIEGYGDGRAIDKVYQREVDLEVGFEGQGESQVEES